MRNNTESNSFRVRASVRHALWLAAIGATSLVGIGMPVGAQESKATLEEIVVTARKREESLQTTPVAISAFTAEALDRQQIMATEDLDRVTPNLQFTSYGPLSGNN